MSQRSARALFPWVLLALLFGTWMPGSWKHSAIDRMHSPLDLAAVAHVTLFAMLAVLLPLANWWRMRAWHWPALGLALALLTEGLQFFAADRHPNLAGIVQDLTGTLMGWGAWAAWSRTRKAELVRRR